LLQARVTVEALAAAGARRNSLPCPADTRRSMVTLGRPATLGLALLAPLGLAPGGWVPVAVAAAAPEVLELAQGSQRVLPVRGVTRLALADPAVADVRLLEPEQVLVTALAPGRTELRAWTAGGRVLEWLVVVSRADAARSGRADAAVLAVVTAVNEQLAHAGLVGAHATLVAGTVFLEGLADSEADLEKARLITRALAGSFQSLLVVGPARMIELEVELVEVSRRSLDRVGVTWPTEVTGSVTLQLEQSLRLRGGSPDAGRLQLGIPEVRGTFGVALRMDDGTSRTLAHPRLVTASGKEASFLAGGEVPIPLVTAERVHVDYREYGIRLRLTPTVDSTGAIRARVLAEVSSVDWGVAVLGVPGFLSRRVDTEVTLRDGDTMVVSGLVSHEAGKQVSKVPLLGQVPILGELFKSRGFQDGETELVIFVTPRLVDAGSASPRAAGREARRKYDEAEKDLSFGVLD
jgi:pilus assembly protein CpaC